MAQEFIERNQKIIEEINQLNAKCIELMDWDYTPPRGFTNPFAKGEEEENGEERRRCQQPSLNV